ncbi:MAG: WD40/YVTN/BNR-like repeat-containing protein, partial [Rhodothermales bacterium]
MRRAIQLGLALTALLCLVLWWTIPLHHEDPAHEAGGDLSEAYEALMFWSRQRAYPNPEIPSQGVFRVFERERALALARKGGSSEAPPWQPLGPHNIGGRTLALAINADNPSTIYAGSASGGLWRSYTGGLGVRAWERVATGFPVLGVGAIAIAPDDTSTLYIGTGEVYNYQSIERGLAVRVTRGSYGMGILKSTDAGATWTKSLDWSYDQRRGVQMIRFNPANSRTVWAATTEGVLVSRDAGATWQTALDVLMATDVLVHPVDTSIVFAACGNLGSPGHGIYRSLDGGATWAQLTNGLPSSYGGKALLALHEGNPDLMYASIGNGNTSGAGTWLARTFDRGDTWEVVSTEDYSTFQGWFAHFVGIHPRDPQRIIAGGVNLWRSSNGGITLTRGDRTNFNT